MKREVMKDRRYIILIRKNGKIYGYCERSFSMVLLEGRVQVRGNCKYDHTAPFEYLKRRRKSYEKYVRGAQSANQMQWLYMKNDVEKLKKKGFDAKLFRLGKRCPIEVDFSEFNAMKTNKMKYDKFLYRNQPFKVKDKSLWNK